MSERKELTAERLRELLHYDAAAGTVTWAISPRYGIPAGDVAGCSGSGNYGYRRIRIDGGLYLVHRVVWFWMTGAWPTAHIDHINLDKSITAGATFGRRQRPKTE